ncbi:MAG: hypothetical protein CBD48_05635 [Cyanobacteria bacterium TMED188]|nr:MAG: hypothetical protein CBD48_05635 [Cyanobacteria bacterium TMED188]
MLLPAMISLKPSPCDMAGTAGSHPSEPHPRDQGAQPSLDEERILCNHCRRTASNGIRCLGMCVADSDY